MPTRRASLAVTTAVLFLSALSPLLRAEIVRLNQDVRPTFQFIDLKIDADQEHYTGSVRIQLEVKKPTTSFTFHAEGQELERIELRTKKDRSIDIEHERGEEGLVTITSEKRLRPGVYTLEIEFSNAFNTKAVGLYRVEHEGNHYLFTQFEAVDARKAFPCWDEPIFKIPFQMSLTVPEKHHAFTNTPIQSEKVSDGWKTVTFEQTKPLPSYLLAIASGPLETVSILNLSVPGKIVTVKGQSHLARLATEATPPILKALEEYFGRPYPYQKLDLIAIPEFWFGAMENPGAITFRDNILLVDPKAASVSQRRLLALVIAHELAHIWFGDLVTMSWWDDLWLNESFASWLGDKITHQLYPQYKLELTDRRSVHNLMTNDARPSTKPIRRPIDSREAIWEDLGLAFGKGQTVLGMMEQWMGPEVFRKGVVNYINTHAWGNSVASDLWNALSKASKKDIGSSMATFLNQPGLPLVTVELKDDTVLQVSQQRFLNYGVKAAKQQWNLPIRLRYATSKKSHTRTAHLTSARTTVNLGRRVDWITPDDGAFGYYRWNVSSSMLLALAEESADLLTPPERVSFLGNAAALLDAGLISGVDYLKILKSFASDPETEVISTVISGLGKVELAFVPDELEADFARYVRNMLRPALNRFGIEKKKGEEEAVSLLRPRLIDWLGDQGHDEAVRRHCVAAAKAYMKDSNSIDPSMAGVALRVAAIEGDGKQFESYKQKFEHAKIPIERSRYLGALGYFADQELQRAALKYALEGSVRPTELFDIPEGIQDTAAGRDLVFDWLMKNYGEIMPRLAAHFAALMPYAAGGCSLERLERARAFFSEPEHSVDGTLNNLEKVADQVTDCVNLRQREGKAVAVYLRAGRAKK